MAVSLLDGWVDSIPSRQHVTQAAFGFNAPRTRAPQAVLLAVPPVVSQRLTGEELFDLVLEVRELALARAARPSETGPASRTPRPPRCCNWRTRSTRWRGGRDADARQRLAGTGPTDPEFGLRAQIADPVWFLARQWELGEFRGEDAAAPVRVRPRPGACCRCATTPRGRTWTPRSSRARRWWRPSRTTGGRSGRRARIGRAVAADLAPAEADGFRFGPLPPPYQGLADHVDALAVFRAGVLPDTRHSPRCRCPWPTGSPPPSSVTPPNCTVGAEPAAGTDHRGGDLDWFSVAADQGPGAARPARVRP